MQDGAWGWAMGMAHGLWAVGPGGGAPLYALKSNMNAFKLYPPVLARPLAPHYRPSACGFAQASHTPDPEVSCFLLYKGIP